MVWYLALFAVGLLAASPFLTSRGVGTGEAYNYSLAVADAVTQMRAGEIPPLVGQTEFAFNGRVHPLRNAPYLFYLAGGLDVVTAHRLTFWQLQNLSLAFSLVAAVFAGYGSLRWGAGCSRSLAFGLAVLYGLSPPLLSACTVNLFMTVHVAVFVPIAIGACIRQSRQPSLEADIVLAAALAAAWLAHPPVALWLTAAIGAVRLLVHWRNPTWQARAGLVGAALFGFALAAFVFASVGTLGAELAYFPSGPEAKTQYVNAIMANVQAAFPGSLLPVTQGNTLGDVQFGYAGWLLLAALLWNLGNRRNANDEAEATRRLTLQGLTGTVLVLLALTLPVPFLSTWLWNQVPLATDSMTSAWPMQRLYLVAESLTIFAAALVFPDWRQYFLRNRNALVAIVMAVAIWTGWQASVFIGRGHAMHWTAEATRRTYLSSNLDLTVTSYAFLTVPRTFVNGVMDPQFEFRLLDATREEIDSPLQSALKAAPVVASGEAFYRAGSDGPRVEINSSPLTLEPGRRYLLTFNFLTAPFEGTVDIIGPALVRHYALPAAGEQEGFGMGEGHRHSVSIWTSLPQPETPEVRISLVKAPAGWVGDKKIADFTLQAVDADQLPIRLNALLPLRFTVKSPGVGFVVTPRRYASGYTATVNDRSVRPVRSPDGQVMVGVPQGFASVELRYAPAPILRTAFWVSVVSWLGFFVWVGGRAARVDWNVPLRVAVRYTLPCVAGIARYKYRIAAVILFAAGTWSAVERYNRYLHAFGPIHLSLIFPSKQMGRQQPLLVTGRTSAGTNVFANYVDANHVIIAADIWGSLYQSDPVLVDYAQVQDLVVNSSGLYPLDHPRVRAIRPHQLEQLRNDFRVELNGQPVLALRRSAYESTVREVTVGETRIGGSLTQTNFTGQILRAERLPLPQATVLSREQKLRVRARFPRERTGITEILLSLGAVGADGVISVTYEAPDLLRLTHRAPDGTVVDSKQITYNPNRSHELEITPGEAVGQAGVLVSAKFDGQRAFGPETCGPMSRPLAIQAGLAKSESADVSARFTGTELTIEPVPKSSTPVPVETTGPLRLIVTLPKDKIGQPEPLLSTGKTGKGDFAYVVYVDEKHIRFGLDHWGVGGAKTDPIAINYDAPHEIEISLGALFPAPDDPTWKNIAPEIRERLESTMEIRCDGRRVLTANFTSHPSTDAQITVGENRIGGSTTAPAFTGEIHARERAGLRE